MATSYNQGVLKASEITAAAATTGYGQSPDRRKLYAFGDRVHELAPEESPFFVYLSQMSKAPVDDSVFRYLENRSKVDWTSRNFYIDGAPTGTVAAGSTYSFTVDDAASSPASIDWLVKGMVFSVNTIDTTAGWGQAIFRIETSPVDNGSDTSFSAKCIDTSLATGSDSVADNDPCQVIGTSFEEGTGSPDVWSSEIEDGFGYTQIFKTAAELTGTAMATRYRGYANEWDRIWAEKLREHKVDIERAMLFNQKARVGGIQYTEGLVGHIVKNSTVTGGTTNFSYTSGKAYFRTATKAELTFDRLLSDFEVIYDPARGGSNDKLALCSLPLISFFNKIGSGEFLATSLGHQANTNTNTLSWEMNKRDGSLGHKILQVDTIHGSLSLVKEPLFRGASSGFMLLADMDNLSYRPLVGNGKNRDTHIIQNVQADDEDLRKDMIITEAGLEIVLPETQALYNLEGV